MARGTLTIRPSFLLIVPIGALVLLAADTAEAAAPTYYNSLPAFQADIVSSVTDDYSNPGYVFIQNNAVMSGVLGETDYMSTGFNNLNIISGAGGADPYYCAGCNGSFQLSFQTTSVGNAVGVNGVGVDIQTHSMAVPYFAFITFGDGTTANIALPAAGQFWGVAAPERIVSIHFGLTMGGTTQNGSFGIDNLIVGDGNIGVCMADGDCVDNGDPCTDPVCIMGMCGFAPNTAPCDDGEICTENDVCSMGVCGGTTVDCDDGNVCTDNFCQLGSGCALALNTNPCDDGDPCTENDVCGMGMCSGSALDCDDGNVCTAESCDAVMGCINEPIMGCCLGDGDCAADELCDPGTNSCVPLPAGSSGGDESTGGAEGTGGDDTTGGETGADGTGGGESGVGGTVVSDTNNDDTGNGDTMGGDGTSSGALTAGEVPEPSGCACTTEPSRQRGAWWLLMAAFGVVVRRRRRAA
ncbi:MYXO-CTERM sorting domain-containing protein [Paraliomyxa miuraensis]|uniref:MYXO-CTERM sorting domain-containing protein n=1 Tax=Paraliomyxa miuraensis TaxID=376150 RepID=UPI002254152B|nr:MYXO-CTERM sorting domain-containing protein [Paraliomyxa miuraensis]MCX4239670.1 MYXO-CTERM sorting domain-containing protein [Paraliomyxa miuraensis]